MGRGISSHSLEPNTKSEIAHVQVPSSSDALVRLPKQCNDMDFKTTPGFQGKRAMTDLVISAGAGLGKIISLPSISATGLEIIFP